MTRDTEQQGTDLDFEQMMGELAAMKTDLANRQANRATRPSAPRTAAAPHDGEPRRTRTRRAQTEPRSDHALSTEAAVAQSPPVIVSSSQALSFSAISPTLQESGVQDDGHAKLQAHLQILRRDQSQQNLSSSLMQKGVESSQSEVKIVAAILGPSGNKVDSNTNSIIQVVSNSENDSTFGVSSLGRSESRRNPAAPLPPKSAQRSRSISQGSTRLSKTLYNENGEVLHEIDNYPENLTASPQEISAPTFGSNGTSKTVRPFQTSSSTPASNGQMTQGLPRLPTRSNSRSQPKQSSPSSSPSSTFEQTAHQNSSHGSQTPIAPPRSRSGSRPLSRSNTFNKSDIIHEHGSQFIGTSTIAEDYETDFTSSPSSSAQVKASSITSTEEAAQRGEAAHGAEHIRKKSSNNTLRRQVDESSIHFSESSIPTSSSSTSNRQEQPSTFGENDQGVRPILRKQKSTDPALLYHQYQQGPNTINDKPSSHHASERRPTHDRSQSIGDPQHTLERGRSQRQEESSSKGGMFKWVRSRSKSKDASVSRHAQETPSYPEYNPALIPSRSPSSAGQRAKSLPRKPSNQNLHTNNDNWPPYPAGALNGAPGTPGTSGAPGLLPQLSRSASKLGATSSSSQEPSGSNTSLNVSTNTNTTHHDKMIRGMGMGSTPVAPSVLLTPQPSFQTTPNANAQSAAAGGMRNLALAIMKQDNGISGASELQMQQRHQQLQQAQILHIQHQQQRLAATIGHTTSPPGTPTSPKQISAPQSSLSSSASASTSTAGATVNAQTQRLVATRIYIQTETDFKSVNLAPNSTALDVLHMLEQRGSFGERGDPRHHDRWTIFEYSKEFMIERPLRDFEVVLDIMKVWETDKDNKFICKSFPARDELTAKEVLRLVGPGQESFVRPHGWVHLETKKNKWVKRYLHITDTAVYHSKDNKFNGESMLCMLRNFDVYAVQVPRKKAPTKFGFALKSSDSIHMFETPEDDYIHYICTESGESLREWLVGLRAAKGIFMYHANPEMVREGQKHAVELMSSGNQDGSMRGNLTEEQLTIQQTQSQPLTSITSISSTGLESPISTAISGTSASTLLSISLATTASFIEENDSSVLPIVHSISTSTSTSDSAHFAANSAGFAHTHSGPADKSQTNNSSAGFPIASNINTNTTSGPRLDSSTGTGTGTDIVNKTYSKTGPIGAKITQTMPSSNNNNGSNTTTGGSANSKHPFMVGSLLQQRVEAEKQEIENMKQQLKMREQAGVIGALRGAVGSSGITNESTTSLNYSPGYVQQQQLQQQQNQHQQQLLQQHQLQMQQLQQQQSGPRFGGPGTLIEKGEARTAQLLERSKSAGTGLMRPSAHSSKSGYQKTRSKSRGAPEDRVPLGGNASPHSQSPKLPSYSNGGAQPVPQGPLLQFEDPNAMIQPGLLLSRAKSAKPALNSGNKNSGTGSQNSNGSSKSRQVTGGEALSSHGNRPRIKPLIDLRNHNTGQDVIKPGLLTNSSSNSSSNNTQVSSYSQSAKSPQRRNKPLLEF